MKLNEAIELLEARGAEAAKQVVDRLNKENLQKIRVLGHSMWLQMVHTEKLKVFQANPDMDELEASKQAAKKAKANSTFRKNFVKGVAGDIEAILKSGGR